MAKGQAEGKRSELVSHSNEAVKAVKGFAWNLPVLKTQDLGKIGPGLGVGALAAQMRSSTERLQCRHCRAPIVLLSLGHLVFYVAVAQILRYINGFKYQRRCHKLTLALAIDRLKLVKLRFAASSTSAGGKSPRLLPEDFEIHYQEPSKT